MPPKKQKQHYEKLLKILGSLSNLFSESKAPFLYYRATENLFCKSFSANNLSRSDVSADASLGDVGVGIKTFLNGNGKTFQKVAEFNKDNIIFRDLKPFDLIIKVAELRNKRIDSTKRIYGLNSMIYHCIVRDVNKIMTFECDMDLIDFKKIRITNAGPNVITFSDSLNEYSFNISKSTLYKRFITKRIISDLSVKILADPFDLLEEKFAKIQPTFYSKKSTNPFVILPLYSVVAGTKKVFSRSGLNQWNARGRQRDLNEIYIPISRWIHTRFTDFFPSRDSSFKLKIPTGRCLDAKVCQDGSKALMTKHNADLGLWLLRDVLNLKEKEVLTYAKLQEIGLDSVIIEKISSNFFSVDFMPSGSYELFVERNS